MQQKYTKYRGHHMPHATLVKVKVYIHGQSGHSTENKDTVASEQNQ